MQLSLLCSFLLLRCFEAPALIHSHLITNQLIDVSVRSRFSQISYGQLVCLLPAGPLIFKMSSFSKGKCSNICSDELKDCATSVDAKISTACEAMS
ncbi:putative inactive leucine-rich repeat receptor-like protein kinase-like [Dorcoceras hygrometricum]|uniref:Putative inactive leucine-rich repeat receptor-like protein kinase-like n=1 Tax=Dorcoceras hygrometricum TaxID=472368 RepID=A0A2Z7BIQ6_9LAMI|nr:putative inactive leucine-rich repeat receptor-like protein kinase-like [Dorcoceras hygrometricum]